LIYKLDGENGSTSYLVTELDRWLSEREVFFEAGIIAALYDALFVCKCTDHPLPMWVKDGALEVIGERLKVGASKSKGPKANDATAYKKDRTHLQRWLAVKKLRYAGEPQDKEIFAKAKKLLSDVGADCSEKTIERSFAIVEKDMKIPKNALKYYRPLRRAEEMLELKPLLKGVTFLKK